MKGVRISFLLSAMVLFTGLCSASAESLEKLNQTELDQLAESEGLRFIHGWDWTSWVDYCKGRGATDDMFVAAFSKVARRTMGAEEETDDAYKCMKAMNVINEFNVAVSNLTTVVQVARFLGDCPPVGFLILMPHLRMF